MRALPEATTILSQLNAGWAGGEAEITDLVHRAVVAARQHTGGAGFSDDGRSADPVIAELIVSSVRRALLNPELSLVGDEAAFTLRPGSFADWSYAEYAVLEQYRAGRPHA